MKKMSTNQEILLFTGTSSYNKSFCGKEDKEHKAFSSMEELEKACCDGLLNDLLFELAGLLPDKEKGSSGIL